MARAAAWSRIRVEDPGELAAAARRCWRIDGPALLDVVTARQELVMPPKTNCRRRRISACGR